VVPFIRAFIDGVNVCIFAYGQTGSGKTYTMEGPNSAMFYEEEEEEKCALHNQSGILPRTAVFLVSQIDQLNIRFARQFTIEASSIEVYCETVRDLLSQKNVELQTDPVTKKVTISGQTWKKITKVSEFLNLIKQSYSRRIFGKNDHHEHSSRSHHIFQVRLNGRNKAQLPQTSLLNVVDLAGSERQSVK
jgi:kinesin family protein C1